MLNAFCRHDLSDEDSCYCCIYGHITVCPFPCKYCEGRYKDGTDTSEESAK